MAGAGKSSLGKELAKHFDFNFIDSDKLIETTKNKPLQEILDENGIERFKKIEEAALLSVEFNKTILATGELGTLRNVARASAVCMMAGADFIKTSTGKEPVNATLPVSLVMMRAIREYHEKTGFKIGYKPAGGISKAKDALTNLSLVKEELGDQWLSPDLFRFGASSLLGDIERQLEHYTTGVYSASYRHAMG